MQAASEESSLYIVQRERPVAGTAFGRTQKVPVVVRSVWYH
jgi:hypothetical protein